MNKKNLETYDIIIFLKMIPKLGNLMSLDLGEKRIGISISNKERTVAISYKTIHRAKFLQDMEIIKKYIVENKIVGLIVGMPLNLKGERGKKAQSIRRLSQEINNIMKLPLLFWDERYSTQAINKMMIKQDLSREKRKLLIDQSAATWILEGVISTINT